MWLAGSGWYGGVGLGWYGGSGSGGTAESGDVVGVSGCSRVLVGYAAIAEPPGGVATVDRVGKSVVNGIGAGKDPDAGLGCAADGLLDQVPGCCAPMPGYCTDDLPQHARGATTCQWPK